MYTLDNFYKTPEWEKLMKIIKQERIDENGFNICEECGKPIVKAYDCIGHHKEYLTLSNINNVDISLNPDNIALVHHRCHNIIHNKLGYQERTVFLIYGSPLSGKTTYVRQNMNEGDLVVDIDRIWECVSGQQPYIKPNRLKSIVFNVRDNLMESVKYRRGKWLNAYIVGGYPFTAERERLIHTLGAREIYIDTSKEICIERLHKCEYRNSGEWEKYIDEWWNKYIPPHPSESTNERDC